MLLDISIIVESLFKYGYSSSLGGGGGGEKGGKGFAAMKGARSLSWRGFRVL